MQMSPNEPGTIYIGAQFLFRSRDHGQTWDRISPDLTTNDPEKQKQEESGGVTVDNSDAETHTTIYSISESPKDGQVIWVGTDDGNVQMTRDGGKTWTNVVANVPGLPKASWVSWVEAGRYDAATAYATFDRHTFGDMDPHVFKTTDYGKTWTPIVAEGKRRSRIRARDQGRHGHARPAFPRHGIRTCGFRSTAASSGRNTRAAISRRCAVRDIVVHPREVRSCDRHARPRDLDHRRHLAATQAHAGRARAGGGVRAGASDAAAPARVRRLGGGQCNVRGPESARTAR